MPTYPDSERPRLPYSTPENRLRPPHLDERWYAHNNYPDADQPRLPPPLTTERQRLPLKELDEKSWLVHNEVMDATPAISEEQSGRVPSLLDEEVDDYRILLQRHRLIQQQLAALEKQESSTLAEDSIIDDTFIDIPVEEEKFSGSLQQTYGKEEILNSQQSNVDRNLMYVESGNEIDNSEKNYDLLESEQSGDSITRKTFLPFKIKPRYSTVPSIKELSQKDLEQRDARQYNVTAVESNDAENLPVKEKNDKQTRSQRTRNRGKLSRARKNRRKRKRNLSQGANQNSSAINSQPVETVGPNQESHVDPYNELEARLMSMADSSVSNLGGTGANRYVQCSYHMYMHVVVKIVFWFEHFQTSLIFIFLCLRFITIF